MSPEARAVTAMQTAMLQAVLPEDQAAGLARQLLETPEQLAAEKQFERIVKAYIENRGDWLERGKPFRFGGMANLAYTAGKVCSDLATENIADDPEQAQHYAAAAAMFFALEQQL